MGGAVAAAGPANRAGGQGEMGGGRATVQRAGGGANGRDINPAPRVDSGCNRSYRRRTPSNKGKQKADVKIVDAPDQPGASATSGDDLAETSARWPDYAGLALVRAEEELPR
jgi:hypothetical protein